MPDEADVTVFISYRRADTSADAGRLYDALRRRFGRDSVFMDVDSIRPGQDWVNAVEDAVGRCDALLALIGPDWTGVRDDSGKRRLEDEFDRVRLEIEAALKADKAVIPVLFEDAHMPSASELPESLRPLVRRNATRLSHASFESDLRGLLRALKTIARSKAPAVTVAPPEPVVESTPPVAAPSPPVAPPSPPPVVAPPPPPPVVAPPPPPPPRVAPPPQVAFPARSAVPPAPAYYPPAQPYSSGAGSAGGNGRLLLLGGGGLIALVVIGFLAWAFLGPKPTPTPTPLVTPLPTIPRTAAPTGTPLPSEAPTPTRTEPATAGPTPSELPTGAPLDFHLVPTYGEVDLDPGFDDDPYAIALDAGGETDVRYLGGACLGYAAQAPDFRVIYGQGSAAVLRFYFISDEDTTLIINDANGNWLCADDTFDTLNPTLDFAGPAAGEYDIWVGTINFDLAQGTLNVTELVNNHP